MSDLPFYPYNHSMAPRPIPLLTMTQTSQITGRPGRQYAYVRQLGQGRFLLKKTFERYRTLTTTDVIQARPA